MVWEDMHLKISMVTICYNAEKTIENTIKSVINQNGVDLEYIIVDGASTDSTCTIVSKYLDKIDTFISEPDNGVSDAFNKGIRLATGTVIGIINADDLLYPEALKRVEEGFLNNPKADIVSGNTIVFTDKLEDGHVVKPDRDLEKLKYTMKLPHPSIFVKKEAYDKYGLFSTKYKNAMDYELISRMYFAGANICFVDNILSAFRDGGLSKTAYRRTQAEQREIAAKNGAGRMKVELFLLYVNVYRMIRPLLQKLHIDNIVRKLIKKQQPAMELEKKEF